MIDPCIFGSLFNGCKTDLAVFWSAVTALATCGTAYIIYAQLQSLKNDSKMKATESYVNLIRAIQNSGDQSGLITQIAAIRAIRHLDLMDRKGAIDDLDSTLQHFKKNSSANTDKLAFELEETIAQLRSR